MSIPNIAMSTLVQPVSTMLRNSLIATGPHLKEIDFAHLEMRIPMLTESEAQVRGQILVKPTSDTHYKLESNQTFIYTRIDADTALRQLKFEDRILPKSDYPAVAAFLEGMGVFTTVKGDLTTEEGDATVTFNFGTKEPPLASKYIDLGSNKFVQADYGIVFYGTVKFTFVGKPVKEPVPEPEVPEDNAIDISQYFLVHDLGNLTQHLLR